MSVGMAGGRHMQALLGSLGRMVRSPFSTTLTVLVIALALALPTALRLLVVNAEAATGDFSNAVELSVYLKTDVPLVKAQQLEHSTRERADVARVQLISADKAMEEFRKYSGFGVALDALKDNPLPHVLHVQRIDDDEDVVVGSLWNVLSGGRRSVEDHGSQLGAVDLLKLGHEFF